jgi:glycosyltransferase involved in cell wall biosynthesis
MNSLIQKEGFLSVVMPCYNEEATIVEILTRVLNQAVVLEVIVIDDCSTDGTAQLIKGIKDPRIRYLRNSKNIGKGASVGKGFSLCVGEFALIQDADLEYSPEEYSRLLAPLLDGRADAVFGSRFLTYDARRVLYFWHRLGNSFLTQMSNAFTNLDLTDMETCYKVVRTEYLKKIEIREKRFGIEPEITAKLANLSIRIYEVPISYQGRTYEEGKKITWKDGFAAIACILKYTIFRKFFNSKRIAN